MTKKSSVRVATVSLGSVETGSRGGKVSCGLALVPVVAAEAEAATVEKAGDEEVGLGEAGDSLDFVGRRHKFYSYPHFHLSPFLLLFTSPYGGGTFGGVHRQLPEAPSTT
ncbi:hypothetical protein P5V15_009765 [Pogonomyrmex californicus]